MSCAAQKTLILLSSLIGLFCFQNFEGGIDIRTLAPPRPAQAETSMIAVPQSGHDLNSVGQDWLARQSKLITGPTEERVLADFNRALNRIVVGQISENEMPTHDAIEPSNASVLDASVGMVVGTDLTVASMGAEMTGSARAAGDALRLAAGIPETRQEVAAVNARKERSPLSVKSVRVLAVNKVRVQLKNDTEITCSLEGGSLQLHLSKSLTKNLDLNIHHEAARANSLVQLHWSF